MSNNAENDKKQQQHFSNVCTVNMIRTMKM